MTDLIETAKRLVERLQANAREPWMSIGGKPFALEAVEVITALREQLAAVRRDLEIAHASGSAMAEEADKKTALARTLAGTLEKVRPHVEGLRVCCGSGVQAAYDEPPECCAQPDDIGEIVDTALAEARAAGLLPQEGENNG